MPTIGAPLRKWIPLLFCSIPRSAYAQPTNETNPIDPSHARIATPTTAVAPASAAPLTLSIAPSSDTTCPFRTINYITHTLPQLCLKTSWSAPLQPAPTDGLAVDETSPGPPMGIPRAGESRGDAISNADDEGASSGPETLREGPLSPDTVKTDESLLASSEPEVEADSPLDNANFLSFEEWKKQNLVRVGQSPENVGQVRAASSEARNRQRPVDINALDSLGEEAEIQLDFGGFGNPQGEQGTEGVPSSTRASGDATETTLDEDNVAPSAWALNKDAGKTCKERFNYASFDCAATILKTNSKAKSSSAVLVENKDSYMLNECSAQNKFVIVEMCDDILVDTVVLANYEFFSSMFRHVRISVSDRYPVKMERWRTLATFEARNSREMQPFLITEPQIWARYLRIEFLTHYGNEFYCPLSLLRVHGTTMMEQFRREEEQARGDDDFHEPIEAADGDLVKTAAPLADDSLPPPTEPQSIKRDESMDAASMLSPESGGSLPEKYIDVATNGTHTESQSDTSQQPSGESTQTILGRTTAIETGNTSAEKEIPTTSSSSVPSSPSSIGKLDGGVPAAAEKSNLTHMSAHSDQASAASSPQTAPSEGKLSDSTKTSSRSTKTAEPSTRSATNIVSGNSHRIASNSTAHNPQVHSQPRGTSQTQPNSAAPTTQESFFKSIHKRLQQLEANSTLSLQYIEEQSRILRDAFVKVEKRQLFKTEKFLDQLNNTVMQELKSYRNMYEQLWQSTILELEGMKERQRAEMGEVGARLSLVADELVWQKRMAVVQSTLLLLCLGLVLFVRSGSLGSPPDMPIVQQLGNKYSNFFDSPPRSPELAGGRRRRRTFRSMWRSDTSVGLSERSEHMSDGLNAVSDVETDGRRSPVQITDSPLTPKTPGATSNPTHKAESSPVQGNGVPQTEDGYEDTGLPTPTEVITPEFNDQAKRVEVLETQSGPATPRGSRDSRPSWEEVDRAIDLLKAEEQGKGARLGRVVERDRQKRRSPLRRTESYDAPTDDSPEDDDGESLFIPG
ncbi:UNC-like C-terminal-domain-containing protein [Massariosphaeria phaeospora]|uniref:UNC-like C-terminal-domain-containing protein n=1 Tax=Massariosphaeria phaeospora TaxID=100035 RepID=A0A7C8HZN6_9PLEO|nr:UNC-like C-terminal-domain-containing protein [Massariosphaeria phaeospora]